MTYVHELNMGQGSQNYFWLFYIFMSWEVTDLQFFWALIEKWKRTQFWSLQSNKKTKKDFFRELSFEGVEFYRNTIICLMSNEVSEKAWKS